MDVFTTLVVGLIGIILAVLGWVFRTQIMALLRRIRLPRWPFSRRVATPASSMAARGTPQEPQHHHPDRTDPDGINAWLREHSDYYTELIRWKEEHHNEHTPRVYEWLYHLIWGGTLVMAVFLVGAIALWVPSTAIAEWVPFNLQWFLFVAIGVYLLAGFRTVDTDEVAGADFFGEPVYQFDSGLKWVPWGILGFNKEPTTFVQAEFPGDANRIQWTDEKTELAAGKVRPLYVLTGEKPIKPGEQDDRMPTDFQQNIGVAEYVQFHLIKSRFFDLEVNIGDIDAVNEFEIRQTITGGIDLTLKMLEVVRQMRDTSGAILLEVLGQLSLNEIRQYLNPINQLLKLRLQAKVMDWGLEIVDAKITKTNAGHDFNEKLQDRGEAISFRDATIIRAEGEEQRLVREGRGKASAIQAELEAKARGYEAIGEVIKLKEGREAMNAQVTEKLAEAGNTVVVGTEGVTQLFGLVKAAQQSGEPNP